MSYDAEELSVQSGAPVELYDFAQGSVSWRYTSSEAEFTDDSQSPSVSYTSIAIERSGIESSGEQARNSLSLTVPRTFPVAELFRVSPPSEVITVTVRRVHRGDTSDIVTSWAGRVLNCDFEGAKATLRCEPITVSLARVGLRRVYQVTCPHVLYGEGCALDKADFDHSTVVYAIDGLELTVDSVNSAYNYAGGFVEWVNDDGVTERRFIEFHANEVLTLMQPFAGIAVTDAVTIYPGCDHTLTTCDATFANALNYGGQPYFPAVNPFIGPVF